MTRSAGTRDGAGASFFDQKEQNDDLDAHNMEAINSAFARAITLIEQKTYSCEIKGLLLLSDAFYRSEERVNFILMNGMDPFEPIDKKIRPSMMNVLKSSYRLQSKELESLKTVLSRIQSYLDKPEISSIYSLLKKKEEGIFQSKSQIITAATSAARNILQAQDSNQEAPPPCSFRTLEQVQNIVILFQSPDITAKDATPLLNELYRMVDYVERNREPQLDIIGEIWNAKMYQFVEFTLQSLSWCLTGLGEQKILLRQGAAVFGQILRPLTALVQKCRDRDAMRQSLEQSYNEFRSVLAINKHMKDSDHLYQKWKSKGDERRAGGGGYRAPRGDYQPRGRNYKRHQGGGGGYYGDRDLGKGRGRGNWGGDRSQRWGQGRGRGRGNSGYREKRIEDNWGKSDWMSDYNRHKAERDEEEEKERKRSEYSSGGGYASGRGRGRGSPGYVRKQQDSYVFGKQEEVDLWGQSESIPAKRKENEDIFNWDQEINRPDQSSQVQKKEKKKESGASQIFQSPGSSVVQSDLSYPSYQKSVLDIKPPNRAMSQKEERKSVLNASASQFQPSKSIVSKPRKFLDVDSGSEEHKEQKVTQTIDEEFYDAGWEEANLAEGRLSLHELNVTPSLDSEFFDKLNSASFKEQETRISKLVEAVASEFKMREQEYTAIGSVCSKIRLAIKRSSYFEGTLVRVVPFGSAGNGSWLSGSSSLNLAVLIEDEKLLEIKPVGPDYNQTDALDAIRVQLEKYLKLQTIKVHWAVAPVIRFEFKEQRDAFKYEVFLSPGALCPVLTSQLLKEYHALDYRFDQLSIFLHKWLQLKSSDGKVQEVCPPYVLQLMLLSFFQSRNPPILPNLQMIRYPKQTEQIKLNVLNEKSDQDEPYKQITINPYFYKLKEGDLNQLLVAQEYDKEPKKNSASTGRLLFEFFYFYVLKFQRKDWIVSPSHGGFILKKEGSQANSFCVRDPFYCPTSYILRAGTVKWDQLFKAFELTLQRFMAGTPILDMAQMDQLKEDKEKCWAH